MAESGFISATRAGKIYTQILRPLRADVDTLRDAYSGFLLDRLGKQGSLDPGIKPLSPGMRICGPAITCLGPDLSIRRAAIDIAEPNDVLIIATDQSRTACFGDGTARRMLLKDLHGIVLDAPTRDAAALRSIEFSTFSRGATPRNHYYPYARGHGAVNVPVVVGGVLINPGDVLFGDDDGIVVVPRLICAHIADGLRDAIKTEYQQRQDMSIYEPFRVRAELEAAGYQYLNKPFSE